MLLIPLSRPLQQACCAHDACGTAVHPRTQNCLQLLTSWSVAHCTEISALIPTVAYRSAIRFSLSNGNKVNARSYGLQRKQSVPYTILSVHYSASLAMSTFCLFSVLGLCDTGRSLWT